jgi:hypothetical protein
MKKYPTLYRADGTQELVAPKNRKTFSMKELQNFVGGSAKAFFLEDLTVMVVNAEGKLDELPLNVRATEIRKASGYLGDSIAGNALVCPSDMVD